MYSVESLLSCYGNHARTTESGKVKTNSQFAIFNENYVKNLKHNLGLFTNGPSKYFRLLKIFLSFVFVLET